MTAPRLPAHYDPRAIDAQRHAPWLIGHLLEEGDREELRWLVERYGAQRLTRWVTERGRRQLSSRSEAFWRLLLAVEPDEREAEGGRGQTAREALWPR